jgi:ferric iron reductase protein FhuF
LKRSHQRSLRWPGDEPRPAVRALGEVAYSSARSGLSSRVTDPKASDHPPDRVPLLIRRLRASETLWAHSSSITFVPPRDTSDVIDLRARNPAALWRAIAARARVLGDVDQRIAASSFMFAYGRTLLVPAMATLVTADLLPDLGAENASLSFADPNRGLLCLRSARATVIRERPRSRAETNGVGTRAELIATLVRQALGEHLMPLAAVLSARYGISGRVLRANVAHQCWWELTQLARDKRLAVAALDDAVLLHSLAGAPVADSGQLFVDESRGERTLRFERSNCCLLRLVPGEPLCEGCSFGRKAIEIPATR